MPEAESVLPVPRTLSRNSRHETRKHGDNHSSRKTQSRRSAKMRGRCEMARPRWQLANYRNAEKKTEIREIAMCRVESVIFDAAASGMPVAIWRARSVCEAGAVGVDLLVMDDHRPTQRRRDQAQVLYPRFGGGRIRSRAECWNGRRRLRLNETYWRDGR